MTELTVVTVTHNSSHVLGSFLACLGSDPSTLRIVIVDSGSFDIAETRALAATHEAIFYDAGANVGYGSASNIGAWACNSSWLAFVNPDVEVTGAALLKLVDVARELEIECVGPQLVDEAGRIRRSWHHLMAPPWAPRGEAFRPEGEVIRTESISGCAMVIRRDVFERLGGFDESFFMFCEEIDLHRRLRDIGGSVAVVSTVFAQTVGGGSSLGVSSRWGAAERSVGHIRYMAKHFGFLVGSIDLVVQCVRASLRRDYRPPMRSLSQIIRARPLGVRHPATRRSPSE